MHGSPETRRGYCDRLDWAPSGPAGNGGLQHLADRPPSNQGHLKGPCHSTEQEANYAARSTNYQARPEDSKARGALIWLDKKGVAIYSKVKRKLGLSDDLASKVLGSISGKKK